MGPATPPLPDSPWDMEVDEACGEGPYSPDTNKILKDLLPKTIESNQWKADTLKNSVFVGTGLRKPVDKANVASKEIPLAGFSALNLKHGKRFRLA